MLKFKLLPLFFVYMLYPIVMIAARNVDVAVPRNWVDFVWVGSLMVSLFMILASPHQKYREPSATLILFISMLLVTVVVVKWGVIWYEHHIELIPYLMEFKPVAYLSISIFWVVVFGKIDPIDFVRFGAVLGFIVIFDFILESALAGKIALPRVSGERNYDACLLLISYVMTLSFGNSCKRSFKILIFLGLLLTFSRTALGAAAVITLLASGMRIRFKVVAAVTIAIFMVGSFALRELPLNSLESMDRYWMWSSTINLLLENPYNALIGFPVGVPLPIAVPSAIEFLWNSQAESWGIAGVYPFHMHAFWLRIAITWGLPAAMLVLLAAGYAMIQQNMVVRGLGLLLLFEGLTMGVFYLGNVGVPLFIAFLSVYNRKSLSRHQLELKNTGYINRHSSSYRK